MSYLLPLEILITASPIAVAIKCSTTGHCWILLEPGILYVSAPFESQPKFGQEYSRIDTILYRNIQENLSYNKEQADLPDLCYKLEEQYVQRQ